MIHHASNHQPVHLDDDNDKLTIKIFTHKIFPMMSGVWQRLIRRINKGLITMFYYINLFLKLVNKAINIIILIIMMV